MKNMQLKRERFAKDIRSKQRSQIFAQNREKLEQSHEHQSLVSLIFLMIEGSSQQQQLTEDSFEDFLDLISEEMLVSSNQERTINKNIVETIMKRYQGMLNEFEHKILSKRDQQQESKVGLLLRYNRKEFDLVRFLIRMERVEERFLVILDRLLEDVGVRLGELANMLTGCINHNNSCTKQNSEVQQIVGQIIWSLQVRLKLHKEILYLHNIAIKQQQEQQNQQKQQQKSKDNTNQSNTKSATLVIHLNQQQQQIVELAQKWLVEKLLIDFIHFCELFTVIKDTCTTHAYRNKLVGIISKYEQLYVECLLQHDLLLERVLFNPQPIDNNQQQSMKIQCQKLIELMFLLLSSTVSKQQQSQKQSLTQENINLTMFMTLSTRIIKKLQLQLPINDSTGSHKQLVNKLMLSSLVNAFVNSPDVVLGQFCSDLSKMISTAKTYNQIHQQPETSYNYSHITQSFIFLNQYSNQKYNKPLVTVLFQLVQDLAYPDLVTLVQLLSIIISYKEEVIDTLFKLPPFQGCYNQELNFQKVLLKLIRHISPQVRRRALWLLSNITASEQFYFYGHKFIIYFFEENVLEQSYGQNQHHQSTQSILSKQQLLINELIANVIMNYLCNLRTYQQIQQLLQTKRRTKLYDQQSIILSKKPTNCGSNQLQTGESLFLWVLKLLAHLLQSLTQNQVTSKQTSKFIQILIYSLYNILSLQESQHHTKKAASILSMMQTLEIPKNIQILYHKAQTINKNYEFHGLAQTLLNLIEKMKNQQITI